MRKILVVLIFVSFVTPLAAQTNKPCYDKIYRVTDVLPVASTPADRVAAALENEIEIPDSLKNVKGDLFISYVITCNGDLAKLKLIKRGDWDGNCFLSTICDPYAANKKRPHSRAEV